MPAGNFVAVFFRCFISGFATGNTQPGRFHFSGKTVHVVAGAVANAVEFAAADKDAAGQAEVADQRVKHHDRPGVIKPIAGHHAAVTDDRSFTSVTGKGFRQRDNLRFRHAALFAVLRQRELFCRLFQALQPALHRDPLAVGERNVLRHEKPCLSASGGIDQLAVGIQHDGGLFAIGRKMA